jgi:hypothetical protein
MIRLSTLSRGCHNRLGVAHTEAVSSAQLCTTASALPASLHTRKIVVRPGIIKQFLPPKHSQRRDVRSTATPVALADPPKVGFIGLGIMGVPMVSSINSAYTTLRLLLEGPLKVVVMPEQRGRPIRVSWYLPNIFDNAISASSKACCLELCKRAQ